MKSFMKRAAHFIVAVLLLAPGAGAEPPLTYLAATDREFLVETIVTEVRQISDFNTQSTLEVVGVRAGPADLKGKTFSVISVLRPGVGLKGVWPPLKIQERGIWGVVALDNGVLSTDPVVSGLPRCFPLRHGISKRVKEAEAAIAAVVVLRNAPEKDRLAQLKEYASSPTPEIALWAAHLIVETCEGSKDGDLDVFLRQLLLSPRTNASARIEIDQHFCKTDSYFEPDSDHLKAWRLLAKGEFDAFDLGNIDVGLGAWRMRKEDQDALIDIARGLADRAGIDPEQRGYLLARAAGAMKEQARAVSFLLDLCVNARIEKTRAAASQVLEGTRDLSPESIESIRKAIPAIKEKEVAATLQRAIAKKEAMGDRP